LANHCGKLSTKQGDRIPITEEDAKNFLRHRGIANTFIVLADITYVPATEARKVEALGFASSLALLFAGVFLGVIFTPSNPLFACFLSCGIILVVIGIAIFVWGVHNEISEWEKRKIPWSVE
jgi:hypothetical protein